MPHHPVFAGDRDLEKIFDGFASRTLPKPEWTHAAHVAASVWLTGHHPDRDMRPMIRAYNEATGVGNTATSGYHETITVASLRAVRAAMAANHGEPLHTICNKLLGSTLSDPDWLLAYWSRARLFSGAARLGWVDPDLRALPF